MARYREQRKQQRRERIYIAAMELLEERGLKATQMRDIAARAELAVGTLYNYYPSKYDLYMDVLEQQWHEVGKRYLSRIARMLHRGDDLFTILRGIIQPVFEEMNQLGRVEWTELIMAFFSSKTYIQRGARMDLQAIEVWSRILEKLKKRGLLRPSLSCDTAAYTLYSVVASQFLALLFLEEVDEGEASKALDEKLLLLIDGIGAAPREEKEF